MQDLVNVNEQLNGKHLFDAFIMQLTKDFEQSNFQADFIASLEPDYASIHEQLVDELQRAEKRADSTVMHLLNRIDISEFQLKKYLNEQRNENRLMVIAELIIKRVLQKVVIKEFYKNNS